MTMLVTVPELSLWAEGDATAIDPTDPLAQWLLEQASALVADECGFPGWMAIGYDLTTVPVRAKIVIANIAKRCWNNADQETRTAITGGPSSAVLDEAALGLRLSDAEIAECEKIREKLGGASLGGGGVWTLSTTRGPVETNGWVPDQRWPQSSPINYYAAADSFLWPVSDPPLPQTTPDEPTNTVL